MAVTSLRTAALMGLCLLSEVLGAKLVVTHFSNSVYTLDFDASKTGSDALKIQQKYTNGGQMPAWGHVDKATNTIMSVDESWLGGASLTQYSIKQDGSLAVVGATSTPGGSVYGSLYGGADGKSFFATPEYTPSTVTLYKLPISSSSKPIQGLTFTMDKPGPRPDRQDKPHPHATFPDPTGNFLIVPDLGADLTRIFKIDRNSGKLTACPAIASRPGDGPRHGVFRKCSGGKQKYYSLNEVSSSVGVYDVTYPSNGGCPSMTLTQSLSNYGPGKVGLETEKSAEIRIAGNHLYASNRNDQTFGKEQDSIAIFKIGNDGKLEFQELTNSFGYYPRSFDISKDGSLVAVGGQTTSNVVILKRNASTGKLGPVVANLNVGPRGTYGGEDGLSSVTWIE